MKLKIFLLLAIASSFSYTECYDQIMPLAFQRIFPHVRWSSIWKLTFQVNKQKTARKAVEVLNKWMDEYWEGPQTHTSTTPVSEIEVSENANFSETSSSVELVTEFTLRPQLVHKVHTLPVKYKLPSNEDHLEDETTATPEDTDTLRRDEWEKLWFENDELTKITPQWKIRSLNDKEFARNQAIQFLAHRESLKTYIRFLCRTGQEKQILTKHDVNKMKRDFWQVDRRCKSLFWCTETYFLNHIQTTSPFVYWQLELYAESWENFPPVQDKLRWTLQTS